MLLNKAGFINFNNTTKEQPFPTNTLGCNKFRIPGIIRLQNGNLFAVCDARWDDAKNDYGGIDTMYAISEDNGKTWKQSFAAYFPDSNGTPKNPLDTTTCIDPCVVQDKSGRIHIIVNMNPTGVTTGLTFPCNGSGFTDINSKKYLSVVDDYSLANIPPMEIPEEKRYYIDDNNNIVSFKNGITEYSVDRYFNLYKNSEPIYQKQIDTDDIIQQNIFYRDSKFHVYNTMFSMHLYSDDCLNWDVKIISDQIKTDDDSGLISSPGNGEICEDGTILMPFYSYKFNETGCSSIVYSTDNGKSWKRTPSVPNTDFIKISTEGKIIALNKNRWRLFFRNQIKKICYADFIPSENEWKKPVIVPVTVHSDCNFSAIYGNNKIYISYPAGKGEEAIGRVNGRLFIFDFDDKYDIKLVKDIKIEEKSFSYSCLSTLTDNTICVLYDTCDEGMVKFKILK